MPSIETIMIVALAGFALSASPGPSMLYVLSRSVGQSRAAGLASAVGLGLGGVVLAVVAALGLAAIFQQSTVAYHALTFVGAAYLIFLGSQMILEKDEVAKSGEFEVREVQQRSYSRIVAQGVLVEIMNPKTVLFFMAFIPPFVETSRGDVVTQMLLLGVLVPLTAMPSDIVVAFIGGSLAQTVKGNRMIRRGLSWLGGLFLIGIGISLFF